MRAGEASGEEVGLDGRHPLQHDLCAGPKDND